MYQNASKSWENKSHDDIKCSINLSGRISANRPSKIPANWRFLRVYVRLGSMCSNIYNISSTWTSLRCSPANTNTRTMPALAMEVFSTSIAPRRCDKLLRKCRFFDHTPQKFWVLPLIYLASEVETWLEQLKHVKNSLRNLVVQNKNNSRELNKADEMLLSKYHWYPENMWVSFYLKNAMVSYFTGILTMASHNPYITGCRTPYIQQITSVPLLRCCLIVLVVIFLVVGHHELVLPTFHFCFHSVISPHIQKDFGVWACDCISFSS